MAAFKYNDAPAAPRRLISMREPDYTRSYDGNISSSLHAITRPRRAESISCFESSA
jgi:hypothetical protein